MSEYLQFRKKIKECIDLGISKFIIFPFSENGMHIKIY